MRLNHRHDFKIFLALFTILSLFLARAQEQITLTTYYPAPYGVYVELRSQRLAVGSNYFNAALVSFDPNATLIVEGNMGIGPGANTGASALQISMVPDSRALLLVGNNTSGAYNGIALGHYSGTDTTHAAGNGVAIGTGAWSSYGATALGYYADAAMHNSVAIGSNTYTADLGAAAGPGIAIGRNARALGPVSMAIGSDSLSSDVALGSSLAVGRLAQAGSNCYYCSAIGYRATTDGSQAIAIGTASALSLPHGGPGGSPFSVTIGANSATNDYGTTVGRWCNTSRGLSIGMVSNVCDGIAMGQLSQANFPGVTHEVSLGGQANTPGNNAVAVGWVTYALDESTAIGSAVTWCNAPRSLAVGSESYTPTPDSMTLPGVWVGGSTGGSMYGIGIGSVVVGTSGGIVVYGSYSMGISIVDPATLPSPAIILSTRIIPWRS